MALFKKRGYKVASVARTIREEVKAHSDLVLTADFSDPSCLKGIFEKVEKDLGVPNVVVYNRELFPPVIVHRTSCLASGLEFADQN